MLIAGCHRHTAALLASVARSAVPGSAALRGSLLPGESGCTAMHAGGCASAASSTAD